MSRLYIALIHYPVTNKHGDTVTTSITPFDVHDIARSALSFGIDHYFVVNPSKGQKKVVERMIGFWNAGFGKTYNPNRTEALSIVSHKSTLSEAIQSIETEINQKPILVSTSARLMETKKTINMDKAKKMLKEKPLLVLFGTGWGLAPEIIHQSDAILEPIKGVASYNHLSVRAAAAIILHQLANKE